MANFLINVLKEIVPVYNHIPGIAVYNVLVNTSENESLPIMQKRKINSEVLLKDVIRRNPGVTLDDTGDITFTNLAPILPAIVKNPNELDHVAFIYKSSRFHSGTGEGPSQTIKDQLEDGLIRLGESLESAESISFNLNPGDIQSEFPIAYLKNMFIENKEGDNYFERPVRGFLDIYYALRREDGTYPPSLDNWSILRIQFGFDRTMPLGGLKWIFHQIKHIKESEYASVTQSNVDGYYPLELLKSYTSEGDIIPMYYYDPATISNTTAYLKIQSMTPQPIFDNDDLSFNVNIVNDQPFLNQNLINSEGYPAIMSIIDSSVYKYNKIDTEGDPNFTSVSGLKYSGSHIVSLIGEEDYQPLI